MSKLCGAAWLAAMVLSPPLAFSEARGQESDLDRVEEHLAEGRFSSARELLQTWLDENERTAQREERQRGTWLRAVLTVDPEMAEVDLQRLVVRYPGGPYSDRALLRLAQGAWVRSEPVRALEYLEVLQRDYPESSLRNRAESVTEQIEAVLSFGDPNEQPAEPSPTNP